jgi:hypothetical protein
MNDYLSGRVDVVLKFLAHFHVKAIFQDALEKMLV